MVSPCNDNADSKPQPIYPSILSKFHRDLVERLNVEHMFVLIDGVLPFEACLYYQVLPLYLDGSRLVLGMVSIDDTTGADYVRRIISYHNYSLITRSISSEALQTALSAYLNYSGGGKNQLNTVPRSRLRRSAQSQLEQPDQNLQQTLVVDSPDELSGSGFSSSDAPTSLPADPSSGLQFASLQRSPIPSSPACPAIEEPPANESAPATPSIDPAVLDEAWTQPGEPEVITALQSEDAPAIALPSPAVAPTPPHPTPLKPSLLPTLTPLTLQLKHGASPIDALTTLPPPELLQELLGRALHDGIGRLYFERQLQHGRVLWSQSGVLQSVLDNLDGTTFQGLINELKLMNNLSLIPVKAPKQVEIERLYQHTRLLLRFRFMPSEYGEEATLQVLRGAALRFYQQQQLAKLERDALTIARQLQTKMSEIRDRAQAEPGLGSMKLEALPALSQLLHTIEAQIGALQDQTNSEQP
ncbi:MAG: hypothetical protein HC881_05900 [Leptolyngbyaceae cyanobacterium SL_7_1]|nr:hypothetical protein [Leptolyngbyaceae cyanobacterium SL_7_1]